MKNVLGDKLSSLQRQVLVGTLLGDAHLRANKTKTKYQYVVLQPESHKEYVYHLYEIFKGFTKSVPKRYVFEDKRFPGKLYVRWSFYTNFQSCFRFYAHQFYMEQPQRGGGFKTRKTVPKLIHRWLTPRAIAYWYMDDGGEKWKRKSLGVRFCTDSFTLSEIDTLTLVLKDKYLLRNSIQKKEKFLPKNQERRKGYRIYVSSCSYPVLKSLVYPFLISSLRYKFPTKNEKEQI